MDSPPTDGMLSVLGVEHAEVMSTEDMEAGCSGITLCQVPDDVEIQDSDILRNLSGDELDAGLKEYRRNG